MKLSRNEIESLLSKLAEQATGMARDKKSLVAMLDAAKQKAKENTASLSKVSQQFLLLLGVLKAYALDRYKGIGWQSVVLGVAAVIYFLNPFDLLPDFLVGGLIDDGLVLTWVLQKLSAELDHFKEWSAKQ